MRLTGKSFSIPFQAEFPLLFIILYLPAYLNQTGPMQSGYFDSPVLHIQMILMSLVYTFFVLYMMDGPQQALPEEMSRTGEKPRIREFLILLGGLILLYGFVTGILSPFSSPDSQQLLTKGFMLVPTALTCLFSAAQEEVFFRFYGYARLRQNGTPPGKSMFYMSLIFAAGHAYEGVPALLFSFTAGLFLTLAVKRGSSLISLIMAHGLFNFLLILINYLSGGQFP